MYRIKTSPRQFEPVPFRRFLRPESLAVEGVLRRGERVPFRRVPFRRA